MIRAYSPYSEEPSNEIPECKDEEHDWHKSKGGEVYDDKGRLIKYYEECHKCPKIRTISITY